MPKYGAVGAAVQLQSSPRFVTPSQCVAEVDKPNLHDPTSAMRVPVLGLICEKLLPFRGGEDV